MKCPHCTEELGLDNRCINPACSYFNKIVDSSYTENKFNNNDFNIYSGSNYSYMSENDYVSDEELITFIGKRNTYYYNKYISKAKNENIFISWNWPSFFLGMYWLLYRKLYLVAAVLIIFTISLSNQFEDGIPWLIFFGIRILLAMFANNIYLKNSIRKISKLKNKFMPMNSFEFQSMLQRKGGVSFAAPIILLVLYIIVIIIALIAFIFFTTQLGPVDHYVPNLPTYEF